MHEMALAESVLDLVENAARADGARRITCIRLEIGALASVVPEALRFCFDAVVRGSLADGARLEIVETPGSAWCFRCAATVPIASLADACPRCAGAQLAPSGGSAMRVMDIEVD
ncbi:MAG: hydrogenase maturation nickel metallochaperone HypA [Betaproteobacteria bacterium]|nr:hydrogenase maturation nickel metallochaperone HypA [Betaproteobacteria bacterium]